MDDRTAELARLGNLLEQRVDADIRSRPPRSRRQPRRSLVAVAIAGAVVLTGAAAYASVKALSTDEVERGLPGGSLLFEGTNPTCITQDDVVYECTLASVPTAEVHDDYTGSAQVLVDDDGLVAGGCRGQDAEGLHWICYVGIRSVEEQIIGPDFLGEQTYGPGVG
jgi:hypothetical protein